jgi:TolB-like protein
MLFNNLMRDTADAYLSDGLASEIASSLARVPRLEVRSPGAVRSAMRAADPDPRTVGRRLNVRWVVEGDFQRGGNRIRIAVRLVSVQTGTQRWNESYTRPASDLLAVQEEIASAVATAIAGELLPQERTVLAARPTRSAEAYDRFLRGNFQLAKRSPAGVAAAIAEYEAATRLDPSFPQAEARIALAYALYLDWGWDFPGVSRDSQLVRGERAADRALALDSLSADGWMARGYLRSMRYPRTLDGAIAAMQRATLLDPRNAEAWHQYGSMLANLRAEESVSATRRALALEPGRPVSWVQLGNILEVLGRDADASTAYDSAAVLDPAFYPAYAFRTWVRLRAGDVAGAQADAEAALRSSPPGETYYGSAPLAAVAAYGGDTAAARRIMAQAMAPFATRAPGPLVSQMLALGLIAAGQPDEAVAVLERTVPLGALLWISVQFPAFEPLRRMERFQRLMESIRPPGAR